MVQVTDLAIANSPPSTINPPTAMISFRTGDSPTDFRGQLWSLPHDHDATPGSTSGSV